MPSKVEAKVVSFSALGIMIVEFSEQMQIRNLSLLNESNLHIFVSQELKSNENVNLSWRAEKFSGNTLIINVEFEDPL